MNTDRRYRVSIPDANHWREQIKCQSACPVHTDARGYIRALSAGDLKRAYKIARGPNPLASICGRVCGAPCEINCRRASLDKAVSIRTIKRFICQSWQSHSEDEQIDLIEQLGREFSERECAGLEEGGALLGALSRGALRTPGGQPVAIVGSGPAGLAAAHDLAILGFKPVIFEMEDVAAGMLYLGVPAYRLPRAVIRAEVDMIRSLGVEIKTGVTIGKDISLAELMNDFSAVVIAVGAKVSRRLRVKGAEGKNILGAVDFLRDVALETNLKVGQKVVVIGGGNVAYDVSRTALRHEVESDVSRTALRQLGVKEVHLCCLESREDMLADEIEIHEGAEEGIILHNSVGPDEILLNDQGAVKGVRFKKVLSIFDSAGRFSPTYDPAHTFEIEADTVLVSIGQSSDFSFMDAVGDGVAMNDQKQFVLDEKQSTTRAGLFVAGDAAHGPKLMIDAVASGKLVARSVYEYVTGTQIQTDEEVLHFPLRGYGRRARFDGIPRQAAPCAPVEQRRQTVTTEVEGLYSQEQALLEAERCLDCGVNTIFDGQKCILCGGCAEACPEQCLKLVSLNKLVGDAAFGTHSTAWGSSTENALSAIIKNGERCTRCGLCASRCPADAITMERFTFSETCVGS